LIYNIQKRLFFNQSPLHYAAAFILAISLAYLIATGNYMALFLFAGTLIGLLLFGKPVYCFWVLFSSVFLMGGIISHFPEITTLRWGIVLLSLMLGVRTLVEYSVPTNLIKPKFDRLLTVMVIFMIIGLTSSLVNGISPINLTVSLKNYFQFVPVAFALAILPHFKNQSMVKRIYIGLLVVALIQLPVAMYQRFFLGAQFIAAGESAVAVQDAVSGTFAMSLRGGSSKALSLFLLFVAGAMISFAKHGILSWRKAIAVSLIFLVPIIFNETKVSFIYLPVLFLILYRKELFKFRIKGIIALALCIALLFGLGYAYKKVYTTSDRNLEQYITRSLDYNFGQRGYGRYDLNRLSVLTFWLEERKQHGLIGILFGHGLDAANEAEAGFFVEKGKMAQRYPSYGIGLTMVSRLLWETGAIGVACFFGILLLSFKRISNYIQYATNAFHASVLLSLQAGITLCILESFVSAAFRTQEVYNFLFSLILGLTLMMTQPHMKYHRYGSSYN